MMPFPPSPVHAVAASVTNARSVRVAAISVCSELRGERGTAVSRA
jgi:hypothetical protein